MDSRTAVIQRVQTLNPFAKVELRYERALKIYRFLTTATWLLVVVSGIVFSLYPHADGIHGGKTIWDQNKAHPTPFALNPILVNIYWSILLVLQVAYLQQLYDGHDDWVVVAAGNVGSHFILTNLLHFTFIVLWVHSQFWIAEIVLVLNLFNLLSLYLRHSTTPSAIHIPVVSAPLAWSGVAILWNGAAMVNSHSLLARILANVTIWSILIYGMFFLAAFKDYTIGLELAILSAALGIHQVHLHVFALQWIFAFVITAVLALTSLAIMVPGAFGKELTVRWKGDVVGPDLERRPLLDDE
ncbi:hypothetical protein G7Y79_00008g024870 [Physcia stellaris]|nr:hypothetical protein G7Y79_00008g024870 [Physcia stellaris]